MPIPGLSPSAGLGLKPEHYRLALDARADGLWYEVHPENYTIDGGPRLAWLEAIRAQHPLSIHAIGLSVGGSEPLDLEHLDRVKALIDRFEPALVSEHMAWSAHDGVYFADLLPPQLNQDSLDRFCAHIDQIQTVFARPILLENPTHYMAFHAEIPEPEFLSEIVNRTGCGLLLDVNNVHISAHNLGFDAMDYLRKIPADAVGEYHIAGFEADLELGGELLIDTHGSPISDPVWDLYEKTVKLIGPRPTLIERDSNLPEFAELFAERARAQKILQGEASKAHSDV
jgi:uncharacterized protein (UPF0276 family)